MSGNAQFRIAAACAALSLVATSIAQADSAVVQWTTGANANNHYYQRIDSHSPTVPLTYAAAATAASAMTMTVGSTVYSGRLAKIDPNFNDVFTFVRDNVVYGASGSGAPATSEIFWVGALSPTGNSGTYLWTDGTSLSSTANSSLNIDHFEGAGPEGLGYFQTGSVLLWDYATTSSSNAAYGYVVEFAPAPEPSTLACVAAVSGVAMRRRRRASR